MSLQDYLTRIGLRGAVRPDLATLNAVHRAHVETIPYEDLDVQFGAPVSRAADAAFDKIVARRRGGWCYEMNGLLGWALEEIGYKVERLAGGVERASRGDSAVGNHLVLIVTLDRPWLVDAGFGDGLIEPVLLKEGAFANGVMTCRLAQIEDGWWRYYNDPSGSAPTFDFHRDVTDEALLENGCAMLQTHPESPFVQNAVVQRWEGGEHLSLRGRVFQRLSADGKHQETVNDADEYVRVLKDRFKLDLPEAAALWPKISARHEEVFAPAAN
jgi:N-hydroxyarylamine O-acetyltransferase